MRIAVAVPPIRDFYLTPHRMSALGASIVAELCQEAGHETKLFLFSSRARLYALPLPAEASYLLPYLVPGEFGPLSFFTRFQHFGPPFEECARQIAEFCPDAIFISSFAYAYAEEAVELARAIRRQIPRARLVVGGAGPSACPEYYLSQNLIRKRQERITPLRPASQDSAPPSPEDQALFDFVVTGEGEVAIPLLLEALDGKGSGDNERLIQAPRPTDAKEIRIPLVVLKKTDAEIWASTAITRGCPVGCRFCSNHLCHGQEFRTAPLEALERALRRLPPKAILRLNFEDDNLLCAPEFFYEALRLTRAVWQGEVEFSAENGLDYRFLFPFQIRELMDFGFRKFNFSLGMIDPLFIQPQLPSLYREKHVELIHEIRLRGGSVITYFIAGMEYDTPHVVVELLRLLQPLPTLVGISMFYPVPGLPGFRPPPALLLRHPGLARGSFAYPWTGALTTEELLTAFRLSRFINLQKKERRNTVEQELLDRVLETGRLQTLVKGRGPRAQRSILTRDRRFHLPPANREMERLFFS